MLQVGNTGCDLESAAVIVDIEGIGIRVNDPVRLDLLDRSALIGCPQGISYPGKIMARYVVWQRRANLVKIGRRQTSVNRELRISGECAREAKEISNMPSARSCLHNPRAKINYHLRVSVGFKSLTGEPSLRPDSMRSPSPAQLHNSSTRLSAPSGNSLLILSSVISS